MHMLGEVYIVHCSEVVPSSEVEMYGRYIGRINSFSIVGRLSTLQSVHYRRFHGLCRKPCIRAVILSLPKKFNL